MFLCFGRGRIDRRCWFSWLATDGFAASPRGKGVPVVMLLALRSLLFPLCNPPPLRRSHTPGFGFPDCPYPYFFFLFFHSPLVGWSHDHPAEQKPPRLQSECHCSKSFCLVVSIQPFLCGKACGFRRNLSRGRVELSPLCLVAFVPEELSALCGAHVPRSFGHVLSYRHCEGGTQTPR